MALEIKNLSYSYPKASRKALDGISLTIPSSSSVAILGLNGSGKSTLARLLNALLAPQEGSLTVDGETDTIEIRRKVGLVLQNPSSQMVGDTVLEDVAFGPCNLGLGREEVLRRVDWSLGLLGLRDLADRSPNTLSGGQRQCVALAGILAMRSAYIVLDEATSMLDASERHLVLDSIERIREECGTAVVLITHDPEEAALCEQVLVLDRGRVAMCGPSRDVLSRIDELDGLGIGTTVAARYARTLKEKGIIEETLVTETELMDALERRGLC